MNIAIDARWIFKEISGIGNYTRQLLSEFANLSIDHRLVVLFNDRDLLERTREECQLDKADNLQTQCVPWGVFDLRSQVYLPRLLRQWEIDVFHSPNYMIPFRAFQRDATGPVRAVTTIHDLIPLRFPDHAPRSKKAKLMPLFRAILKESAKRSSRILTVSQASRADILHFLHVPDERVAVVYNGVAKCFTPGPLPRKASSRQHDGYQLLYVGRADPYKNVETLVKALAQLRQDHGMNVSLHMAGAPDPRYPEPLLLANSLGIAQHIHWSGYLHDDDLADLYRTSDVLVHASRCEGFGLQILEAMACGIPVVSSNAGSLPEVVGEAGRMVTPDDLQGFVTHIKAVLTQPALAEQMRNAGIQQASRFSWKQAALETLEHYQQAASTETPS